MYSILFPEDSLLPRERLAKEGVEALSNQELLAILLRTGTVSYTHLIFFNKDCTMLVC